MQTTLCVFLVDDSVSACCIEGDFTVSAVYSQPVKAVLVEENGNGKLIPGFNDQDVAGIISSYCSLSNSMDYMKPIISLENVDSSASTKLQIPLCYLVNDIKDYFSTSVRSPIANLLFCCPMHIYAAYTFVIEEAMKSCGFENVFLVNDGCLYAYSFLPKLSVHNKKEYVLSIHSGSGSSYVACNVLHHGMTPMSIFEEMTEISEQSVLSQLANQLEVSSEEVVSLLKQLKFVENATISSSDSGQPTKPDKVELSQTSVTHLFTPLLQSLQLAITSCLQYVLTPSSVQSGEQVVKEKDKDKNQFVSNSSSPIHHVSAIILDGLFAIPALVNLIRTMYPYTPVFSVQDDLSDKIRGCMHLLASLASWNQTHSSSHPLSFNSSTTHDLKERSSSSSASASASASSTPSSPTNLPLPTSTTMNNDNNHYHSRGYHELYAYGDLVYRGQLNDGQWEGFGEQWEGEFLLYRGQFCKGQRCGQGMLYLSPDEKVVGVFENGRLKEGEYITRHANGQPYYEGVLRNECRQGVGKVYDQEGKLEYEGCFVDGKRHGQGRLRRDGWWYEGAFADDELEGDVSCYDTNRVLREVCQYEGGARVGTGKLFSEQGFLLYEGGLNAKGYYGHGVQYYPGKGTHYEGEFLNGLFHGYGQLYSEEGDLLYIGNFREGLRDGEGKEYTVGTRLLFTGKFHRDQREGKGKLFYSLGHFYDGEFLGGVIHGEGHLVWSDGRSYHGMFAHGVKQGQGTFTWTDGSRYEGEWKEDKRCGTGRQYSPEGRLVYEGEWENDVARGEGVLFLDRNVRYEGTVENLLRCGKGQLYNQAGDLEYDGEWKDDKPHGYGKFFYGDGVYYEGAWVEGQKDGMGRLNYKDGRYFIGMFKNGMKHGKGCIISRQGKILSEGEYVMNEKQ